MPGVRDSLTEMGAEVLIQSRSEFASFMTREAAKWAHAVKRCGALC
jgi:hypothetical protein